MAWSQQRIEDFKSLHQTGLSFSLIAEKLGGFDHCKDGGRSACIGMAHRLKLPERDCTTGKTRKARAPRRSRSVLDPLTRRELFREREKQLSAYAHGPVAATEPSRPKVLRCDHIVQFMQLENRHCRYPLWTGDTPFNEQWYCGIPDADVVAGRPYCAEHDRITSGQPRREAAE